MKINPLHKLLLFIAVGLIFINNTGFSQEENERIDSLIFQLTYLEESPEKVDLLNELGEAYSEFNPERAQEYSKIAYDLSKKINYKEGTIHSALNLGTINIMFNGGFHDGVPFLTEALEKSRAIGNELLEMKALMAFADSKRITGFFDEALDFYQMSLEIAERIDNKQLINDIYSNIADVYLSKGEKELGIKYLEKNYLFELDKDFKGTTGNAYHDIGHYFFLTKSLDKAEFYYKKAIQIFEKENNFRWITFVKVQLAHVYLEKDELESAILASNEALSLVNQYNLRKEKLDVYHVLAQVYTAEGDFHLAKEYWQKWGEFNDSLKTSIIREQNEQYESSFEKVLTENKIIKLQQEKENNELRAINNELNRDIAIGAVIVLAIILFLLFLRMRYKSRVAKKMAFQQAELAKLSYVASSIDQMVIIATANDEIEYVNEAYIKRNGFTLEEALGKKISQLNSGPKTSKETIRQIDKAIYEDQAPFMCDILQYTKDKEGYWARYHITPILNEAGVLIKYVVVGTDATKLIEYEEEIKELSLVASKTDNSIIIFDANHEAIWVNRGFTELTGLTFHEVLGKKPHQFTQGEELAPEEKYQLEMLFNSGQTFHREGWGVSKTGRKYCISMAVTPILNDENEVERFISVATDITELKLLEEKYEKIVEDSTDIIAEIDVEGNFTFVNKKMTQLSGYSRRELLKMDLANLVREDYRQNVVEFYKNQYRNKEALSYIEFPWINKNNEEYWVGQNAKLKMDSENKEVLGFNFVARDITEKHRAEIALERSLQSTELLGKIGKEITASLSVREIIEIVYKQINELMDADVFAIGLANNTEKQLEFPIVKEAGEILENVTYDYDDADRIAILAYNEGKDFVINDFVKEFSNIFPDKEVAYPKAGKLCYSVIYLPLIQKGKKIGVITVQSYEPNAYDENHLNIIRNIAVYVAIALENAGLYQNMEEKVMERTKEVRQQKEVIEKNLSNTKIISEIGLEVASTFDFGKIVRSVHQKVSQMMPANVFGVRLYNESNGDIINKYEIRNGQLLPEKVSKISDDLNFTTWCLRNNKEIFINNRLEEYSKYTENNIVDDEGPISLIYYPMNVGENLIGLITVQSWEENAYEPYHLDILRSLAAFLGTAIDNADLYETLEQKVEERTEELNQKNKDITASINYAKRIQRGILPSEGFMKQLLPESFVFYRPRDIVSGDFYWMDRKDGKILFAAVDCTGHGVPGALISIIGRNLLDQAVNEKGFTVPAQILNFLQIGMMLAFDQSENEQSELYDGMDISLCSVDLNNMTLEFAGANNPLYLVREGELIIQKGDKMGISAQKNSGYFQNFEMDLEKGDMIYLFSDGYPDQFGGSRNKKLTYRRMGEIFVEIAEMDSDHQLSEIEQKFDEWIGSNQQTDDICVIGAKI